MKLSLFILFLFTSIYTQQAKLIEWKKDKYSSITESYKIADNLGIFVGELAFTYAKKDKSTQSVNMMPDFTYNKVLIPKKDKDTGFSYGITCEKSDENMCEYDETKQEDQFGEWTYVYQEGTTIADLPMDGADYADIIPSFKFRYLLNDPTKTIKLGETGVIGLRRDSTVFDYIKKTYDLKFGTDDKPYFDFSFVVFSQKGLTKEAMKGTTEKTFDNSMMYLRSYDDAKVNKTIGMNSASVKITGNPENLWAIGDVSLYTGEEASLFTTDFTMACFAPHFDGTLVIQKEKNVYNDLMTKINSFVTGSDTSKVLPLNLKYKVNDGKDNLIIQFKEAEFIIEAKEGAVTESTIKEMSKADISAFGCGDADLVFGRLFFQRNYVVFRKLMTGAGGLDQVSVSQYLPLDKITESERMVLLIFGCVLILLIVIALIYRCSTSKNSDEEEFVVEGEEDKYAKV